MAYPKPLSEKSIERLYRESGLTEEVYNDFYIGEDSEVTIIAGCGIHTCGEDASRHDGVHSFHIGKNAKVTYVEKHYGEGDEKSRQVMNPTTVIHLKKGASMMMETSQIAGIDDTLRSTTADLEDGASRQYGVIQWFPKSAPLRQKLEGRGYSLYNLSISSGCFNSLPSVLGSLQMNLDYTTEDGLTAEDIAYENSIMQILLNNRKPFEASDGQKLLTTKEITATDEFKALADVYSGYYQKIITRTLKIFDYLATPDNIIPNAGIAYFAYTKTTHVPFLFQADGTPITSYDDFRNWRDIEVYNGTYTFALRQIMRIIDNILDNDPDSIILVQSDHGARYHTNTVLMHTFSISDEDQRNIFNALYYRGQEIDIEGLSGSDTWRVILNLLGDEMPLQCGKKMDDIIVRAA